MEATGRLRHPLGGRGAATTPGTALDPGGCHRRGRPGLSRAPTCTPQSSKSILEVWVQEGRGAGRRGSKGRFSLQCPKLMGDAKEGGRRFFFYGATFGRPFAVPRRSSGDPGRASSGASGGPTRVGRCPGRAGVRRAPIRIGRCPGVTPHRKQA